MIANDLRERQFAQLEAELPRCLAETGLTIRPRLINGTTSRVQSQWSVAAS
ncbi:hypothetical protein [Streptomyces shenzhenensis]|uniref:hypothetical protein n=1 Tax=Streptomyces shenzhenensis TaxID=943815 RepID=UPI003680F7CB